MTIRTATLAFAATLALAGCATTAGERIGPTEVTRYHLGTPVPAGSVSVEPSPGTAGSLEYDAYAAAVAGELARIGFVAAPAGSPSDYIATASFVRASRGTVRTPPKFSIGFGGGGYSGGGVGLGGGISTGIGAKTREMYVSELFVQLRRRGGSVVWEGRAQRPGLSGQADSSTAVTAQRLANALFRGFPGESGITTSVP